MYPVEKAQLAPIRFSAEHTLGFRGSPEPELRAVILEGSGFCFQTGVESERHVARLRGMYFDCEDAFLGGLIENPCTGFSVSYL